MEVNPDEALEHLGKEVASLKKENDLTWKMIDDLKDGYLSVKYPDRYSAIASGRMPVPEEAAAPAPTGTHLVDPSTVIMSVDAAEAAAWDEVMAAGDEETEAFTIEDVGEPDEPNDGQEQPTAEQIRDEQPTDEQPAVAPAVNPAENSRRPDKNPRNYRRIATVATATGVLVAATFLAIKRDGADTPRAGQPAPEQPIAAMLDGLNRPLPPLAASPPVAEPGGKAGAKIREERSADAEGSEAENRQAKPESNGATGDSGDAPAAGNTGSAQPRTPGAAQPEQQPAQPQKPAPKPPQPAPPSPAQPAPGPQRSESPSPFLYEDNDPSDAGYNVDEDR